MFFTCFRKTFELALIFPSPGFRLKQLHSISTRQSEFSSLEFTFWTIDSISCLVAKCFGWMGKERAVSCTVATAAVSKVSHIHLAVLSLPSHSTATVPGSLPSRPLRPSCLASPRCLCPLGIPSLTRHLPAPCQISAPKTALMITSTTWTCPLPS